MACAVLDGDLLYSISLVQPTNDWSRLCHPLLQISTMCAFMAHNNAYYMLSVLQGTFLVDSLQLRRILKTIGCTAGASKTGSAVCLSDVAGTSLARPPRPAGKDGEWSGAFFYNAETCSSRPM